MEKIFLGEKCIFHCEKNKENGWIKQEGEKTIWNKKLVKRFWEEIRDKVEKEKNDDECDEHDFSWFVFPLFQRYKSNSDFDFWKKKEKTKFSKKLKFDNSKFLTTILFSNVIFSKEVSFL